MTGEIDPKNPRHANLLAALAAAGAFEVRDGKVVINFHNGHVQSITVEERRYQHVAAVKGVTIPI